jgi:cobalt-zinc-cadmium efflux system outer membrane protein
MTSRLAILTHAAVLTATAAFAQVPSPERVTAGGYVDPAHGLSVDAVVALALEQEPALRAARADVEAVRALQEQAALRPNPSVSFAYQAEPGGTDRQTRIDGQWPLDLSRKAGRVNVAERETEVTRHAVADRSRRLAAEVRLKYGDVAAAVRGLSLVEDLLAATIRQLSLVSARVEAGAAPALERDLLQVEVGRLSADRFLAQGETEAALIELKRTVGLSPGASLALRDSFDTLVATEMSRTMPADAAASIAQRPDVQEATSRITISDAQIERAEREAHPDVSLLGSYMRVDAGFPQRGFSADGGLERVHGIFHYITAGAMVTIPILSRNQGEVAAARARRSGAAALLDATRLAAASEIAAARARDAHAAEALGIYTRAVRELASRNVDVVRQTYELGRATLFEVLNEQRRYLDTEKAYINTLRAAYRSRQDLRLALGDVQ